MDTNQGPNRTVYLDTETTGFLHDGGDRIIEIGAIEYIDREPTGRIYHVYVDPQRDVPEDAYAVHGLSRDDLVKLSKGKVFKDVAPGFIEFIQGAEMIAHNSGFDEKFLNAELRLAGYKNLTDYGVVVTDSLLVATQKHPGQANSLDALLKRYLGSDNYQRDYHGALLDASLLARVYLLMTVEQNKLELDPLKFSTNSTLKVDKLPPMDLPLVELDENAKARHEVLMERLSSRPRFEMSSGLEF